MSHEEHTLVTDDNGITTWDDGVACVRYRAGIALIAQLRHREAVPLPLGGL